MWWQHEPFCFGQKLLQTLPSLLPTAAGWHNRSRNYDRRRHHDRRYVLEKRSVVMMDLILKADPQPNQRQQRKPKQLPPLKPLQKVSFTDNELDLIKNQLSRTTKFSHGWSFRGACWNRIRSPHFREWTKLQAHANGNDADECRHGSRDDETTEGFREETNCIIMVNSATVRVDSEEVSLSAEGCTERSAKYPKTYPCHLSPFWKLINNCLISNIKQEAVKGRTKVDWNLCG